ncbi:hypothetical protein HY745_02055 [Candidatus Desantisbacteria bacterium]|nr:hypothetical protein [Candidatus Desantisbacteria bacterium]
MSTKLMEDIKESLTYFPIIALCATAAAFIEAYFSDKRKNKFSDDRKRMEINTKKRNIKNSEDKD